VPCGRLSSPAELDCATGELIRSPSGRQTKWDESHFFRYENLDAVPKRTNATNGSGNKRVANGESTHRPVIANVSATALQPVPTCRSIPTTAAFGTGAWIAQTFSLTSLRARVAPIYARNAACKGPLSSVFLVQFTASTLFRVRVR